VGSVKISGVTPAASTTSAERSAPSGRARSSDAADALFFAFKRLIYHIATPRRRIAITPSVTPTPSPTAAPVDKPSFDVAVFDDVARGDEAVVVGPVVGLMEFEVIGEWEVIIAVLKLVEVETAFRSVLCHTMGTPFPDMIILDAKVVVCNVEAKSKYVATKPGFTVHAHI
jgi:hypothetical protein